MFVVRYIKPMKIFKQISIIFLLCIAGDIISGILPFPFPRSVIAMLLLFLLLMLKIIKPYHIEEVSNFLTSILAFLFVSTTVSIVQYFDILKNVIFKFIAVCIIAAIITFAVTAYTVSFVIRIKDRRK